MSYRFVRLEKDFFDDLRDEEPEGKLIIQREEFNGTKYTMESILKKRTTSPFVLGKEDGVPCIFNTIDEAVSIINRQDFMPSNIRLYLERR